MTIDLTGGLEPEQDYVFATRPTTPTCARACPSG